MRKLIKKILRESDELDWIRDINPINHDYLKKKAIYFNPPIDNQEDLDRILDYLESVDFDFGSWYRNYDWENDVVEGLYLEPHDYVIYTSNLFGEDYEEHISNYAGRPVEVLDGWSIF